MERVSCCFFLSRRLILIGTFELKIFVESSAVEFEGNVKPVGLECARGCSFKGML